MPSPETLNEARRAMTLCNACRYCEGFCATFHAMELRTVFSDGDLTYLANLCHDCRGCYYACPFTPPHEFALNVPATFADLRLETYQDGLVPNRATALLGRPAGTAVLATGIGAAGFLALAVATNGWRALSAIQRGAGSFYAVVPFEWMVGVFTTLALLAVAGMGAAIQRRANTEPGGGVQVQRSWASAWSGALRDAAALTYLGGGGHGCAYPEERFSLRRRALHQTLVAGFALAFLATSVAALYHHALARLAPYPLTSLPVLLGSAGGVAMLVGARGLLRLRRTADSRPESRSARALDAPFLWMTIATATTGFAVLALRSTAAMGAALVVHLGVVAGLFVTAPFGKLVHAAHRLAALLRWHRERPD